MGVLGDWRHKDLTICHIIEERQIRKGWKESGKFEVEGVGSAQTAGKGISTCMREHWGHEHLLGTQKLPIPGEVPM